MSKWTDEVKKDLERDVVAGKLTEEDAEDIIAGMLDARDVREEQRTYRETMLENCSGDFK